MTPEPLSPDESVDEAVDGRRVVAEYGHLKAHILLDQEHTAHQGRVTIVRDSLVMTEGGDVIDKIRGGSVQWDENYLNQPCTRVDDDPHTFDRISLERKLRVDGRVLGTSSIIYSETTEITRSGEERLVIEKLERYSQRTPDGDITGERFVRVVSPTGEVLEFHHHRSRGVIPSQ